MEFSKLEKNICDIIKEEQIKLGYRREVIRLYYPLLSLNRLLHSDLGIDEMGEKLAEFGAAVRDRLGEIEISHVGERFCLCFPPETSEYIDTHTEHAGFLYDFVEKVSEHHVSMEDVIELFRKYSDCVHVERRTDDDFDYLVYFEDGEPDSFRYCLTDEGCHIIYHRFTLEDYNDFYENN